MLCMVCVNCLEGLYDASCTPRLGLRSAFKECDVSSDAPEIEKYIYGHHKTLLSFKSSAGLGCALCSRFDPEQPRSDRRNRKLEATGYFSCLIVSNVKENEFSATIGYHYITTACQFVRIRDRHFDKPLNMQIPTFTGSPDTWSVIEDWTEHCVNTHTVCMPPPNTRFRPTRLLAIDGMCFSLVAGQNVPSNERYVTLSHCWGNSSTASDWKLMGVTEESLRIGQPISSLPKTFREAMVVATRFRVKYIWIDKLCILQDSVEDWRVEATAMQDVYKHSFLTISALGAADDKGGCFFDRNPADIIPSTINFRIAPEAEAANFRYVNEESEGLDWHLTFARQPLLQRAWVVQERVLSPRVLHFGREQVFWECRETHACETHSQTVDYQDRENKVTAPSQLVLKRNERPHHWKKLLGAPYITPVDDGSCDMEYEQLFRDWNILKKIYANCSLTNSSDKLPAISGLANDMKRALRASWPEDTHRYLAGLWREKLIDELTWSPTSSTRRGETYIAPSWTWASMNGPFDLDTHDSNSRDRIDYAEIQGAETETLGGLETGEVRAGSITLVAPLLRLQLGKDPYSHVDASKDIRWRMRNLWRVKSLKNPETVEKEEKDQIQLKDQMKQWEVLFDDIRDVVEQTFAIPLKGHSGFKNRWTFFGLTIARKDGEQVKWRRTGFVCHTFEDRSTIEALFERFPQKQLNIV